MPVRRVALVAQALEDRSAPANLRITNLRLSDGNGNAISTVSLGEQVVLRADWVSDNLTAGQQYFVRFTFDGVNFDNKPISAEPGAGLLYAEVGTTWFATPGSHTVSAKTDGGNSVGESNESDNTLTLAPFQPGPVSGPQTRFVYPISSKPRRSVAVANYVDVDPHPNVGADYKGGPFQYDGHGGWDIIPSNFAWMDAGTPVLAAAPGEVVEVIDGYFDRETSWNGGQDENVVTIDYGNGWRGWYVHFAANSITVKLHDHVTAGQMLGLAGSSGQSGGTHLHFGTYHNFAAVEPLYDPGKYFSNPPVYQGDDDPIVIDSGTTNFDLLDQDWPERPSEVTIFPVSGGGFAYTWFDVSNFPTGATVAVKWYRPDGTLAVEQSYTPTSPRTDVVVKRLATSTLATMLGAWEAVLEINGKEIGRNVIRVTAQAGEPEIRVTQASAVIVDERTTPIDFGTVGQGSTPPQQIFTINNHGYVPLTTSNFIAPPGFSLVGQLPSFIPVGSSADFTLRMETGTVGDSFGVLKFDSSDTDESTFNFLVKGKVTGTPNTGAPVIALPGPAVPFVIGEGARLIDPGATFTDSDSPNYANGGKLRIEIIQGGSANDRLGVRNQGTGSGQIGVSGSTILFGGTAIGTMTGGTGTDSLVVTFNTAAATPAAIQALLQNLTYKNIALTPDTRPRFLRVTVAEPPPSAKTSNVAIKRVSLMMDPFNDAPTITGNPPTLPAVLEDAANPPGVQVLSFTSSTVSDPDGIDPKGIAVVGLDPGRGGTWQYSLDGGTTWKAIGSVSNSAARLLREIDFVRFVPALNVNGGSPKLTYRAWDQSTGLFGSMVDLTPVGSTGETTAFSNGAMTVSTTVIAVNDPPTFTKGTDDTVAEDSGPRTLAGWATQMTPGPPDEAGQSLVEFQVTTDNAAMFSAGPAVDLTGKLTYTPAPNANGSATVSVRLKDNGGTANGGQDTSDAQTFTITITPVNDAPVLDNTGNMALGTILEDQTSNSGTLITDLIASAGGDRITDVDAGAVEGIAVVDADTIHGSWQYSINSGGNWSALGATSTVNARLLAADATTRIRFVPVADFNGVIAQALTFRAWDRTSGANGDLASTSPNGGTTAFSTSIETASLAITPVNDPPSFSKGPDKTVFEDAGPQAFGGWATNLSKGPPDEDMQSLSFEITGNTNPSLFSAGPAVDSSGKLTFTTALNQNGSATITLRVRDNGGTANGGQDVSPEQSFSIVVNPVNDPPTFTAGPNQRLMQENAGAQTVPNWAKDIRPGPPDEAGQSVTFQVTEVLDPSLFAVLPAVSPTGTLTYTPAAGVHGYSTIKIRLKDNGGTANGGNDTSPEQSFWIGVNPVNQAPSFTAGGPVTAPEDAGVWTVPGWATDIWPGSFFELDQVLSFEVVSNPNPGLFAFGPAIQADGTLVFQTSPDANGEADIAIQLRDDGGTLFDGQDVSTTQSFHVTLFAVNDAPSFVAGDDPSVAEDSGPRVLPGWATAIAAGPAEESGQAVAFDVVGNSNPALFSAPPSVAADGTLTFTPAADAFGSASIQVRARDDGGTASGGQDESSPQSFTITVRPVNDAPAFSAGANLSVVEDAGLQTVMAWATGISAGPPNEVGQALSFEITANTNPGLFATLPAVAANGTLTYTPADNAFGAATVTIRLHDSGGTADSGQDTSPEQSFSIVIRPVNDAPSFVGGDDQTVDEDPGLVTVHGWATRLTAGPPNESNQSLAFTVIGNSNPALFASGPAVAADGTLTFIPAENANGEATVMVQIADDGGTADGGVDVGNTASFTIRVLPVNDPPVAADDSVTARVGKSLSINVLANDSDVDHDLIRVLGFSSPAHGSLRRQGNNLLYTTRLTAAGSDAFTYTVTDGHGGTATASVAITVVDTIAPRIQTVRLYYGPAAYADASALARGVLPWERLHRIAVVFSEGVIVNPAALTLTGPGGSIPTTFSYDAVTRTATWTPTIPVTDGRVTIRLAAAGVTDTSGNALAADWGRTIGMLTGDYDGNGIVTDADLRAIKRKLGKLDRFADIDGSGLVDAADYALALANKGRRLR